MGRVWVICRKIFSVSLVFNALLTIACILSILGGFYYYYHNWKPFYPFIVNGNVFWIAIAAAALNIFPSARLGRDLHTGRFLFHHYFYGIVVLVLAAFYVTFFTPVTLLTLFVTDNTTVAVNFGRFFFLGGLALLLDDLPDVSTKIESALNWMKDWAHRGEKIMNILHVLTGIGSLYVFVAVLLSVAQNTKWITLANVMVLGSVFITGITSFIFVKRSAWLRPPAKQIEAGSHH